MCLIPVRVESFSKGGRGDECPRAEGKFALSISLRGHGVSSYVPGWTSTHTFSESRYPGCSSEA
jgi:hypothetical protein